VTVRDFDGTQVELVDGDNVQIRETPTGITIVRNSTDDDIVADPVQEGTVPGFNTGEGTVVSSTIECTDDDTNPAIPTAPACPAGTELVVRFTSDDTLELPYRRRGLQVRYAVEEDEDQATANESFELSAPGGDTVESA
jgi:hypothetical protein